MSHRPTLTFNMASIIVLLVSETQTAPAETVDEKEAQEYFEDRMTVEWYKERNMCDGCEEILDNEMCMCDYWS